MNVIDAMNRRRTTEYFEPDGLLLSRDEIEKLIADACLSPSEFNLQPWRFIVVRDLARKEILYECTDHQEKIRNAVAVLILCGDSMAFQSVDDMARSRVEAECLREEEVAEFCRLVTARYEKSKWERALLAVRNPAFAGMSLMLLALERGIASAPIFSFSEEAIRRSFHIQPRFLPVMLIALGLPSTHGAQPSRGPRVDTKSVVFHEDMAAMEF
ncbi:MAG: nitroreductase family protein [Deltaproteobacteria bacterium]|nr:nitroreductase family protein [Deltaproteobacteria bacterium]